MHSRGVMHRDLKPENILLRNNTEKFDLVIGDFGLAAFLDSSTFIYKVCGTPGYVAPEVINHNVNKTNI